MKRFLMEKYHIPAANLVSAGYGKEDYKTSADPFAPENRRVEQVVGPGRSERSGHE